MKTLLFCTSFCKDTFEWEARIKRWLDHHSQIGLDYTNLFIIDDGSPVLPDWQDVELFNTPFSEEIAKKHSIIHFKNNLGRSSVHDYPGWFRSFALMAKYAFKFGFDKVVHVESDAYLTSKSIVNYVNSLNKGWTTLWCPYHKYPETAIQIICKDQVNAYYESMMKGYNFYRYRAMEMCLPFTLVNKQFTGDRYLEYTNTVPLDCDYSCQSDYRLFTPFFVNNDK